MSKIIRVVKESNYTTIDNQFINNVALSWQATGMMTYLLSKKDNWEVIVADLEQRKTNGRDSVRNILKELEDAGYLVREAKREGGQFGYDSTLYERPHRDGKPAPVGKTDAVKPSPENPTLVIPETVKTELIPANKSRATKAKKKANPNHAPLKKFFLDQWQLRYKAEYYFTGIDARKINDLDGACGHEVMRGERAIRAYLSDTDPFIAKQKHPLKLLDVNRYPSPASSPSPTPSCAAPLPQIVRY